MPLSYVKAAFQMLDTRIGKTSGTVCTADVKIFRERIYIKLTPLWQETPADRVAVFLASYEGCPPTAPTLPWLIYLSTLDERMSA